MKDRLIIILPILIGSIFSVNCSQNEPEANVPQPTQILEMHSDAKGMFNVIGPSLYLRVSSDGKAEFEFTDPEKTTGGVSNSRDVNITKRVTLTGQETDELVKLLEASASLSPNETYNRKCCCTDTGLDFHIKIDIDGQKQEVLLSNFCDVSDVGNPGSPDREIPKEILNLYDRINIIRDKYKSH